MESPSRVQLESYYNTIGQFPLHCSQFYTYPGSYKRGKVELSLTLEHSMPISIPAARGSDKPPSSSQTSPAGVEYLAGRLRVLQVVKTSFWLLLGLPSDTSSSPSSTSGCFEAVRCSSPEILVIYGVRSSRAPYAVAPEPQVESQNQAKDHFSLFPSLFSKKN